MSKIFPTNALEPVKLLAEGVSQSLRPLPSAPDGYYDWEVDEAAYTRERKILARVLDKLSPIISTTAKPQIGAQIAAAINEIVDPQAENDRLGAFETGLSLMSMAPQGSKVGRDLSDRAIASLYNAIPHPPDTFLGPKYAFRHADGGFNNIHIPDYGRAGMPYARSVQPKKCIHPSSLPDPELVFETLLKSRKFVSHAGGNSSFTFAYASIVTHSIFKTNYADFSINEASSYLDLSPLYGNNDREVQVVRSPDSNGRGLLRPDTFSDIEMTFLPPACGALLVLFNRNHNYIAEMILKLNEKKRWTDPPPTDPAKMKAQDDEVFETARLVNCGHFISLIMNDYVAGFLGLSEGHAWSMNAFDPIKFRDGTVVTRGQGNHVSVEFNLLYRWHTTTSEKDEQWTKDFFANSPAFQGKSMDTIDLPTFIPLLKQGIQQLYQQQPHEVTFGGLQRGPDGMFPTEGIAKILQDATEAPAGQYRAQGTPAVLRPIEILGMEQARRWGVCTMNEFRKFLGLKQFDSFEEWNPDPEIAEGARRLYGHIDNLELYTGLQCEQYMPLSPGLRFSCGYTMTRAVLSDAIALIRGDRYFTTAFTPATMTSWGFQDATTRPDNGGFNGHMPKLLMRHFPLSYPYNSVYGIFPFFTPEKMKDSLTRQGIADKYTFTRPTPVPTPKFLDNFEAINFVFNDPERFISGYDMKGLGLGYGFVLAMDDRKQHDSDKALASRATIGTRELFEKYVHWFRDAAIKEIKDQTWKAGDMKSYVDIVEVINNVHTYWAADMMCGIPIKTKENPRAQFTVREVHDMFADLFTASFLGYGDIERSWSLIEKATKSAIVIQGFTAVSALRVATGEVKANILKGWAQEIADYMWPPENKPWFEFLSRLASAGRPVNQIVAFAVGLATGSSVNQAQSVVNVIDFYLDDSRKEEYDVIQELIRKNDEQSNKLLQGYVREAMRLDPQFTGLWRVSKVEADIPGTNLKVQPGDRIWGGFKKAHLNPEDFPNPLHVDPTRDPSKYQVNGGGFHLCIGVSFAITVIAETLKVVFGLKNVRRAPGATGQLAKTTKIFNQVETNQYIKPDGTLTDWPVSMHLAFDD